MDGDGQTVSVRSRVAEHALADGQDVGAELRRVGRDARTALAA